MHVHLLCGLLRESGNQVLVDNWRKDLVLFSRAHTRDKPQRTNGANFAVWCSSFRFLLVVTRLGVGGADISWSASGKRETQETAGSCRNRLLPFQGRRGSVPFSCGLGVEWFARFLFAVQTVPLGRVSLHFSTVSAEMYC